MRIDCPEPNAVEPKIGESLNCSLCVSIGSIALLGLRRFRVFSRDAAGIREVPDHAPKANAFAARR
jgi:hypothetical protein